MKKLLLAIGLSAYCFAANAVMYPTNYHMLSAETITNLLKNLQGAITSTNNVINPTFYGYYNVRTVPLEPVSGVTNFAVDFTNAAYHAFPVTNLNFAYSTNWPNTNDIVGFTTLLIVNTNSFDLALSWPSAFRWINAPAPTNVAPNRLVLISFRANPPYGDDHIVGGWGSDTYGTFSSTIIYSTTNVTSYLEADYAVINNMIISNLLNNPFIYNLNGYGTNTTLRGDTTLESTNGSNLGTLQLFSNTIPIVTLNSNGVSDALLTEGSLVAAGPNGQLISTNVAFVINNMVFSTINVTNLNVTNINATLIITSNLFSTNIWTTNLYAYYTYTTNLNANKITVNNIYAGDTTITNGIYFVTNAWSGPTNTIPMYKVLQTYDTYTPISITGLTDRSNYVGENVLLKIRNKAATNIGWTLSAGFTPSSVLTGTITNGTTGTFSIFYDPNGPETNYVFHQF